MLNGLFLFLEITTSTGCLLSAVVSGMGIKTITFSHQGNLLVMSFDAINEGFETKFRIVINEPGEQVYISSGPKWNMPTEYFDKTLEFIAKLNFKLVYGHIDLDESDGEVRYKTSADFGKATDIKPVVQNFMNLHVGAGKTYIKALEAIKEDGASVTSALGRLSVDDYGPSGFCSSILSLMDADPEQAHIPGVQRTPPTRQQSQEQLAALLNALGLGNGSS